MILSGFQAPVMIEPVKMGHSEEIMKGGKARTVDTVIILFGLRILLDQTGVIGRGSPFTARRGTHHHPAPNSNSFRSFVCSVPLW